MNIYDYIEKIWNRKKAKKILKNTINFDSIKSYGFLVNFNENKISPKLKSELISALYKCKLEKSSEDTIQINNKIPFGIEALRFLAFLNKYYDVEVLNFYKRDFKDIGSFLDLLYVDLNKNKFTSYQYKICYKQDEKIKLFSIDGKMIDDIYINIQTISYWLYIKYVLWPRYHDTFLIWSKKYADVFKCIEFFGKTLIVLASIKYLGIFEFLKHLINL